MSLPYTKDLLKDPRDHIGDYTYGEPRVLRWQEKGSLAIGKFCSIGPEVTILLNGQHRMEWVSMYPFLPDAFEDQWPAQSDREWYDQKHGVTIGSDVWIGFGATILPGVTIGDGAVIGAKAVVTGDVEPYAIVGGNPAKMIRMRFDEQTIQKLLTLRWWDWPKEAIHQNLSLLLARPGAEILAITDR